MTADLPPEARAYNLANWDERAPAQRRGAGVRGRLPGTYTLQAVRPA